MNEQPRQVARGSDTPTGATPDRSAARRRFGVELPDGRGITFTTAPFRWKRWRGDVGYGHVRNGVGSKRWRCYQWPFGLINVYGRWGA